jgi:hypothetical protein
MDIKGNLIMVRSVTAVLIFLATLGASSIEAQGLVVQSPVTFKNFVPFKQIVTDIDFYASNRKMISPYEKPAEETIARLKTLFGENLPKGAIFICSTLAQKDSIFEPKVLKSGYSWTLTEITSEVRMQEMQERMKAQMGSIPKEFLERIKARMPEMMADVEKQAVSTTTQHIAYAVLQAMLAKDLKFRSSRIDDMGKSPLPDWLDIGIASYASGASPNISFLQQNMDQTFSIEDIISISRPFTSSSSQSSSGGNGGGNGGGMQGGMGRTGNDGGGDSMPRMGSFPQGGFGGGSFPQGGFGGGTGGRSTGGNTGGQRVSQPRVLPKDEQDRMLFDSQSATFFSYMVEKAGIEKVKKLINEVLSGKESREVITLPEMFGPDFGKIEDDWTAWVKALKAPQRQGFPGPGLGMGPL